jgi:Uma2 family endonuclease
MEVLLSIDSENMTQEFVEMFQKFAQKATLKLLPNGNNGIVNLGELLGYYEKKGEYTQAEIEKIATYFPINKQWTYQDLVDYFPHNLTIKVEIIDNQLFIMPLPLTNHQDIQSDLAYEMKSFVKQNNLGKQYNPPYDVKLPNGSIVQPDVVVVLNIHIAIITKKCIEGVPDLVVEILSQSDFETKRDNKIYHKYKHDLYENQGITEYWTVYPDEKKVCVEVLQDGKYQMYSQAIGSGFVKSFVLEGFGIEIENLLNY